MVYITGDTHGDFGRFYALRRRVSLSREDIVVILGDAGLNFYGPGLDRPRKHEASRLPVTFLCIHGNHEMRPGTIPTYVTREFQGGQVLYEPEFPNILFARDGDVYKLGDYDCLVIGGAYSVDKFYRLQHFLPWFPDEQPSEEIKERVESVIARRGGAVDIVLSHTCPIKYEPREVFLPSIPQYTVDKRTEIWLGEVERGLTYRRWYCGHFHTDKTIDKLRFMYNDIDVLRA